MQGRLTIKQDGAFFATSMFLYATTVTAAAGEYYIAYQLSARGYVVAIPRANVPILDLMVSDASGQHSISIQVKTSSGARRDRTRIPEDGRSRFDVGEKGKDASITALYKQVRLNHAKLWFSSSAGEIQPVLGLLATLVDALSDALHKRNKNSITLPRLQTEDVGPNPYKEGCGAQVEQGFIRI